MRIAKPGHRDRTRGAILKGALQIYAREGYDAVSMRALAKELGCRAPSLYNYFPSREHIFDALRRTGLKLLLDSVGPWTDDPLEDLRRFFWRFFEFSKTRPEYFRLLWVEPSAPAEASTPTDGGATREEAWRRVRRCIEAGIFPADVRPARAALLLWSVVHVPAVLLHVRPATEEPEQLEQTAREGLDLTLAAIQAGLLKQPPSVGEPAAVDHTAVAGHVRRR